MLIICNTLKNSFKKYNILKSTRFLFCY